MVAGLNMINLACIGCGGVIEGLIILPLYFLIRKIIRIFTKCKICDCPCHNDIKNEKANS